MSRLGPRRRRRRHSSWARPVAADPDPATPPTPPTPAAAVDGPGTAAPRRRPSCRSTTRPRSWIPSGSRTAVTPSSRGSETGAATATPARRSSSYDHFPSGPRARMRFVAALRGHHRTPGRMQDRRSLRRQGRHHRRHGHTLIAEFRAWYLGLNTVATYSGNYAPGVSELRPAPFDRASLIRPPSLHSPTLHRRGRTATALRPTEVEFEASQSSCGARARRSPELLRHHRALPGRRGWGRAVARGRQLRRSVVGARHQPAHRPGGLAGRTHHAALPVLRRARRPLHADGDQPVLRARAAVRARSPVP